MNAPKFEVGQVVAWTPSNINRRTSMTLTIDVKITGRKTAFGRYIYTVAPIAGSGSEAINEDGLKIK